MLVLTLNERFNTSSASGDKDNLKFYSASAIIRSNYCSEKLGTTSSMLVEALGAGIINYLCSGSHVNNNYQNSYITNLL